MFHDLLMHSNHEHPTPKLREEIAQEMDGWQHIHLARLLFSEQEMPMARQ